MYCKLINKPTLEFIDSGVGMCYDKGSYGTDNQKGLDRIDRVCNKLQHDSMLRFATYIFEVDLSTSSLLEHTRHSTGVDYAVRSTRYVTKQNPDNIKIQLSNNEIVNQMLNRHIEEIKELIKDNPSFANDDLKLLLPQAYIYRMQVIFNAQSLKHFLRLRTARSSHYHIRALAKAMFNEVPDDHKFLFEDVISKDSIC
jgi:thymidylate synthase (FAD)